jgi:HK97 family phage portal protein
MNILAQAFGLGRVTAFSDVGWIPASTSATVRTTAGELIGPETAWSFSAAYACVRVLAEDVAKRERKVFKFLPDGGREEATTHPVYKLITQSPNDEMTSIVFWGEIMRDAASWHGGFAEIERDGVRPVRFNYIHPSRVVIQRDERTNRLEYLVRSNEGGDDVLLPWEDVIHIHGVGYGLNGAPFIKFASEALGLGMAAQRFSAAFYGNGMHIATAFKTPGKLSDKALDNLRDSWTAKHAGASKAFTPAILEEGLDIATIGVTPDDAQNVEQRMLQIEEACRFWRVNPQKVQHLIRATFNNVYELNIDHETDTLEPWFGRIEQELDKKVLKPSERGRLGIRHVRAKGFRGSLAEQGQYLQTMFNVGGVTIDDLLVAMERNPIGGDVGTTRFVNGNLVPVDQIVNGNPAFGDDTEPPETEETAPEPEPEPVAVPEEDEPEEEAPTAKQDGTHIKLLALVADPLVRIEGNRMEWALKKYAADRDGFRSAVLDFWDKHAEEMCYKLIPATNTVWEVSGGMLDSPDSSVKRFTHNYCTVAAALFSNSYEEISTAELIADWRRDKSLDIGVKLFAIATGRKLDK